MSVNDVVCTLTSEEFKELTKRFNEYANTNDSTSLDRYKQELATQYGFEWNKISVTGDGKVRKISK